MSAGLNLLKTVIHHDSFPSLSTLANQARENKSIWLRDTQTKMLAATLKLCFLRAPSASMGYSFSC